MPGRRGPFRLLSIRGLVLTSLILACGGLAIPVRPQVRYTITDLGVLPGYTESYAYGINNQGHIVGACGKRKARRAFLFSGQTMKDLGSLGGANSSALCINDAGLIAGWSSTRDGRDHACLYAGGTRIDMGTLGGDRSNAYAINGRGEVVGTSDTPTDSEGFRWDGKRMSAVEAQKQALSYACGINDAGQIVGYGSLNDSSPHALLYKEDKAHDLGVFGGDFSIAWAINQKGEVVGQSSYRDTRDAKGHAFLYRGGKMIDLGTLGGEHSDARALNNIGQIVGHSSLRNGVSHAFLFDGKMVDLNSLLPPGAGWELQEARGINDKGQIVGYGLHAGKMRAFLLTPTSPDRSWDQP